jgi:16S rRNA (uracil1498-N3)-methyltransferase
MYHFFAEHENIQDTYIDITGTDVNHIKNVLRMKAGDQVIISSGDNIDYYCHLADLQDEYIRADIDSTDERGRELPTKIYLFQGLPKADKMELIVQKTVELGVFEVIPVAMKRSVVKLDQKKAESKGKRWNAIAESAAKQSKRSIIPQVIDTCSFQQALTIAKACDVKLLPYECADGMNKTKELIGQLEPGKSVAIFIGPEGGFDQEELDQAQAAGFEIITLGRRILRTETAGLMLLSVLMYHFEQ